MRRLYLLFFLLRMLRRSKGWMGVWHGKGRMAMNLCNRASRITSSKQAARRRGYRNFLHVLFSSSLYLLVKLLLLSLLAITIFSCWSLRGPFRSACLAIVSLFKCDGRAGAGGKFTTTADETRQ